MSRRAHTVGEADGRKEIKRDGAEAYKNLTLATRFYDD
jgi:hypothetical protein